MNYFKCKKNEENEFNVLDVTCCVDNEYGYCV